MGETVNTAMCNVPVAESGAVRKKFILHNRMGALAKKARDKARGQESSSEVVPRVISTGEVKESALLAENRRHNSRQLTPQKALQKVIDPSAVSKKDLFSLAALRQNNPYSPTSPDNPFGSMVTPEQTAPEAMAINNTISPKQIALGNQVKFSSYARQAIAHMQKQAAPVPIQSSMHVVPTPPIAQASAAVAAPGDFGSTVGGVLAPAVREAKTRLIDPTVRSFGKLGLRRMLSNAGLLQPATWGARGQALGLDTGVYLGGRYLLNKTPANNYPAQVARELLPAVSGAIGGFRLGVSPALLGATTGMYAPIKHYAQSIVGLNDDLNKEQISANAANAQEAQLQSARKAMTKHSAASAVSPQLKPRLPSPAHRMPGWDTGTRDPVPFNKVDAARTLADAHKGFVASTGSETGARTLSGLLTSQPITSTLAGISAQPIANSLEGIGNTIFGNPARVSQEPPGLMHNVHKFFNNGSRTGRWAQEALRMPLDTVRNAYQTLADYPLVDRYYREHDSMGYRPTAGDGLASIAQVVPVDPVGVAAAGLALPRLVTAGANTAAHLPKVKAAVDAASRTVQPVARYMSGVDNAFAELLPRTRNVLRAPYKFAKGLVQGMIPGIENGGAPIAEGKMLGTLGDHALTPAVQSFALAHTPHIIGDILQSKPVGKIPGMHWAGGKLNSALDRLGDFTDELREKGKPGYLNAMRTPVGVNPFDVNQRGEGDQQEVLRSLQEYTHQFHNQYPAGERGPGDRSIAAMADMANPGNKKMNDYDLDHVQRMIKAWAEYKKLTEAQNAGKI